MDPVLGGLRGSQPSLGGPWPSLGVLGALVWGPGGATGWARPHFGWGGGGTPRFGIIWDLGFRIWDSGPDRARAASPCQCPCPRSGCSRCPPVSPNVPSCARLPDLAGLEFPGIPGIGRSVSIWLLVGTPQSGDILEWGCPSQDIPVLKCPMVGTSWDGIVAMLEQLVECSGVGTSWCWILLILGHLWAGTFWDWSIPEWDHPGVGPSWCWIIPISEHPGVGPCHCWTIPVWDNPGVGAS